VRAKKVQSLMGEFLAHPVEFNRCILNIQLIGRNESEQELQFAM